MVSSETHAAVWFLHSEEGEPLGPVFRTQAEAIPAAGTLVANGASWKSAEVIEFAELRATCAVRRFRVVVRVSD